MWFSKGSAWKDTYPNFIRNMTYTIYNPHRYRHEQSFIDTCKELPPKTVLELVAYNIIDQPKGHVFLFVPTNPI